MEIVNSRIEDIDEIFRLYRIATVYQKERVPAYWPAFERSMVETEIQEKCQWKILIDNQIACVFATTFDDRFIWEERNTDQAVYLHRIATHPDFRGQNLVAKIVLWAKKYAIENGKEYVRLDTVGENRRLIAHYCGNGFDFLGLFIPQNTRDLPAHYHNTPVSLFQLHV